MGSHKNKFPELAPRFRLDLTAPIEQLSEAPGTTGIVILFEDFGVSQARLPAIEVRRRQLEDGMSRVSGIKLFLRESLAKP